MDIDDMLIRNVAKEYMCSFELAKKIILSMKINGNNFDFETIPKQYSLERKNPID